MVEGAKPRKKNYRVYTAAKRVVILEPIGNKIYAQIDRKTTKILPLPYHFHEKEILLAAVMVFFPSETQFQRCVEFDQVELLLRRYNTKTKSKYLDLCI